MLGILFLMKTPAVKPSVRLLSEAARYEILAQQAALRAVLGDRENRASEECLAHDHMIRSETYKAAASLVDLF